MRKISYKCSSENYNTHFMFNNPPPRKSYRCMLDKQDYTPTRKQVTRERALILRYMYIACLVLGSHQQSYRGNNRHFSPAPLRKTLQSTKC